MAALEPYRLEPERVQDENEASDEDNEESERLNNLNWCSCERCEVKETTRECICCLEVPESEHKFTEGSSMKFLFFCISSGIALAKSSFKSPRWESIFAIVWLVL